MRQNGRVAASALLLSALACQPAGPLSDADIAGIEATSEAFHQAALANDWAGLAATYTEDAVLMPPNEPPIEGRADIQRWFASFPPVTAFELENIEIDGRGDLAYVRGTFMLTIAPEGMDPITDTAKFIEIRRKQPDGSWLLSRDVFNSDLGLPE